MWRDRLDDEGGVALIYVLFATVIISGLVVVFMSRVLFETRATAEARDYEAAIHVAEAGAEALFGAINSEGRDFAEKVITTHPDGSHHTYDVDLTQSDAAIQADEEAWAVGLAMADPDGLVTTDEGEAYGIRPANASDDEAEDMVFGVGFVPSMDAADPAVRVVKMRIGRRFFHPEHALLTGGDLDFGGNASILAPDCDPSDPVPADCHAHVHSNGDVDVSGSSHEIQGNLTASETLTGTPNTTGGTAVDGEEAVPVPNLHARDFYHRDVTYNPDPATGETAEWFDLCNNGTSGTVHEPSSTPCAGAQVWPDPVDPSATNFRGWEYKSGTNTWEARKVESGIFYVHGSDAAVNGSAGSGPRAVTIIVEGDSSSPGDAGSLELSGNPSLVSALPDVLFVADRDLKMKGTAGGGQSDCDPAVDDCDDQNYSGFIHVREQVDISGTVFLSGALIAQDVEDQHGLVTRNNDGLNGTMTLDYDQDLELDLSGRVTIEFWNEL